jgi:hydrogenase-4 component B
VNRNEGRVAKRRSQAGAAATARLRARRRSGFAGQVLGRNPGPLGLARPEDAASFAEPLRRVFAELYRPAEDLSIDFHPASKYFVQRIEYRAETHPWFETMIYEPAVALLSNIARRVRRLQSGLVHLDLAYIALALFLLLVATHWIL